MDSSSVVVDLANLQWWQALIGLITVLGLSPAPWLLGLASGKIQFSAPAQKTYTERIQDLDEHHKQVEAIQVERYADLKESRNYYRDAFNAEHDRANKATETVAEVLDAIKAINHVMSSINLAAEEVASDQR